MRILSVFLVSLIWAAAVQAKPHDYQLDPVHSRIVFFVQHAGFSRAIGTFSGIEGELRFDTKAPQTAQVAARIPIGSLDLGDAKWRERVLDPTFFDVKRHPQASFASRSVEAGTNGALRIVGELSLHGVTREVTLDATLNRAERHPLTLRSTLGFSARTTLSRAEFGFDNWKKLVGDEVEVQIEIEATRTRRGKETENDA